tara:strand:+ start:3048 stop:4034 length:987 start_codon:yes stop_codon:yes gene_type:complete
MISKFSEIAKLNLLENKFLLFHGKNEGLKNDTISSLIEKNKELESLRYDEKEILDNKDDFYESILNKSLFGSSKLIIINRSTDKLLIILEEIFQKNLEDIIIILNSNVLDKKSKLRSFFEKKEKLVSIAFYPDTNETLTQLSQKFFNKIKIPISYENINIIVNKCGNDRGYLKNELKKIALFSRDKKKIETEDLIKLINLTENFSINDLIDVCLSKNNKKTVNILNENNFGNEDYILIIRTFLNKSKRLLNLLNDYEVNKDLNKTIEMAKPQIFWKDKEIIRKQIKNWTPKKVEELIYNLNSLEIEVKKLSINPIHLISDFILEKSKF